MTDALNWLRLGLSGMALVFLTVTGRAIAGQAGQWLPSARQMGVGLFTNFFDTLGIGSFAPTTALFRLMRMIASVLDIRFTQPESIFDTRPGG